MGGRGDLGGVAGARERSDPIRARDRDRGREKNWLADIWGVLGEVVAIRTVNEVCPSAPIWHHPIDFERSVDVVDIVVDVDRGPVKLETKAHLLDPRKRWFMVNERAHQRSLGRGAEGYLPIISVLGGPRVHVGALLRTDVLDTWGPPDKVLRDPAIGVPLSDLAIDSFGQPLDDLTRSLADPPVISGDELARIASQAGVDFDDWRHELPALGQLPATALRDAVLQARERIDLGHDR